MTTQYDTDYYGWTKRQAELIRQGRFNEIDVEHVAEELEDMGGSKECELESRLGILIAHLLKWRFQPERRGKSWRLTIKEQRHRVARLLRKNPGLKSYLDEAFKTAYFDAVLIAARETPLEEEDFPTTCPFTLEQTLVDLLPALKGEDSNHR